MQCANHPGRSSPLGATIVNGGVNFSLFSLTATGVELLLFDQQDDTVPSRAIPFDPAVNRSYHYWHAFVPGVQAGQLSTGIGFKARPLRNRGSDSDPGKVVLDPYGRGVVVPKSYSREAAGKPGDNAATAMKNVVVDPKDYDWEGDQPLERSSSQTIIYEMHVRGFTHHTSSGLVEQTRGTYAGLVEKIPYLQQLGITAVELLPVFQFDVQDSLAGQHQLLGLRTHFVLRSARSL